MFFIWLLILDVNNPTLYKMKKEKYILLSFLKASKDEDHIAIKIVFYNTIFIIFRCFHSCQAHFIASFAAQHRPFHDLRGIDDTPGMLGNHSVDHP